MDEANEASPTLFSNNEVQLMSEIDVKEEIEDEMSEFISNNKDVKIEIVTTEIKKECFEDKNEDLFEYEDQKKSPSEETKSEFDVGMEASSTEGEVPEEQLLIVAEGNFSGNSMVFQNKSIDTAEKPYSCIDCNKSFSLQSNLKRHKHFSCDLCKKTFGNKSIFVMHKRIHTGEKPYTCDVCQKTFTLKCNLIIHRRTHTGEKPFTCDLCPKAFAVKNRLIVHRRIHTGEKPYKCDVCQKAFSDDSTFKKHKRIHTGEKPYSCKVCHRTFSFKSNYDKHYSVHH